MTRNLENRLWSGVINFPQGEYELIANSVDGAANETKRNLNWVKSILAAGMSQVPGAAVKNAHKGVCFIQPSLKDFVSWDASVFGQQTPRKQKTMEVTAYFYPPANTIWK